MTLIEALQEVQKTVQEGYSYIDFVSRDGRMIFICNSVYPRNHRETVSDFMDLQFKKRTQRQTISTMGEYVDDCVGLSYSKKSPMKVAKVVMTIRLAWLAGSIAAGEMLPLPTVSAVRRMVEQQP